MSNFIEEFWLNEGHRWNNNLTVRFPPEPNGHLHIGHAKAVLIGEALHKKFGGVFILRMDDTNPEKEEKEFEDGIVSDLDWLGVVFDKTSHASDYFEDLKNLALAMIEEGSAFIDTSSPEELALMRGDFYHEGTPSPTRDNPILWHKNMFTKMLDGTLKKNEAVLRAKLDMASKNIVLRDPVLFRTTTKPHPKKPLWHALPTYDFTHPFCDVMEGVSLSLCSLEFEERKPLYNWVVSKALLHGFSKNPPPCELEFARLTPSSGPTSKRVIKKAIDDNMISGWDDARLLTLKGLKNKGYTPSVIKSFVERLGVSRSLSLAPLEYINEETRSIVGHKNAKTIVEDPVRLVVKNAPPTMTIDEKEVPCSSIFWVGKDDVMPNPTPSFFRLSVGNTVRVRGLNGCVDVVSVKEGENGFVTVYATFVTNKKPKATIHVVPEENACFVDVVHPITWEEGDSNPNDFLIVKKGVMLAHSMCSAPHHAVRVGWGYMKNNRTWMKTCGMKPKL